MGTVQGNPQLQEEIPARSPLGDRRQVQVRWRCRYPDAGGVREPPEPGTANRLHITRILRALARSCIVFLN